MPTKPSRNASSLASSVDGSISTLTSHKYQVGQRVFGARQGAYATHILAEEDRILPIPAGWNYTDAAGLYVTAPTSYGALVHRARIQPGEFCLVHA